MSSLSRRYRSARPDTGDFTPPNPKTFGAVPFGDAERSRLDAWLREAAWPRNHMNMPELEGFLTGLIAWPVTISSGAWLPLVWGERGWKVPTNILSRPHFDEFVTLTMGFMQELDRELSQQSSRFESSVLRALHGSEQIDGLHSWGRGFLTALTLDSQGLKWRSASAGEAVRAIAGITSSSAQISSSAVEEVVNAVISLMEQRASRGPLGPLAAAAHA